MRFGAEKKYVVLITSVFELANILCNFGFNLKRGNGEPYKQYTVKPFQVQRQTHFILSELFYKVPLN